VRTPVPILLIFHLLPFISLAQQSQADTATCFEMNNINNKSLRFLDNKYANLSNIVDKQTLKLIDRMHRKEAKLKAKLQGVDSAKAEQLFAGSQAKYEQLKTRLQSPIDSKVANPLKQYIPGIDSMQTAMQFLSKSNLPIPADKFAQIQSVAAQAQQLQGSLQQANEVQQFVREREAYLKQQLQNTPLVKSLSGVNKQVYYYQQQLKEYKEALNDPGKLGEKILSTVSTMPAFQKFFQNNSYLSQLFRMPGTNMDATALAGLQTRAGVQNILSQRIGAATASMGMNPQQYFGQQMQAAQSQISAIKDKFNQFTGGGNSDMTMPDFKPNNQHTKTFLQRVQYGFNIQSQQGTNILPARSDLALMVGYKLSDNKIIGIGASYNLGLGHGFSHIKLTNEGVGLRSFTDIKFKGSFWISGGFEYTYYQSFAKFSNLPNIDVWQRSALLGITKKYSIGKRREGNMQLLYDFLAIKETPRGQQLKFRLGYSF